MTSRRHLLGAALIGALPLTGCGFRLRGSYSTPFRTLYLQMPENSYLAVRLRQELLAGSDVTIVNTPSEAEAILELLSDSRSRDVLSINDTGRAREYEITLSLSFRVSNPSGIDYMEAVTLTASRDLTYSESDFLSREKEEAFLYRDMEADLVNQLMYDKVDAVVVDGSVANQYVAENDDFVIAEASSELGAAEPYCVAVQKGDPKGLLPGINEAIAEINSENKIEEFIALADSLSGVAEEVSADAPAE